MVAAPCSVTAQQSGHDEISITWSQPSEAHDSFKIQCNSGETDAENFQTSVNKSVTTAKCNGLTPGASYDVSVVPVKDGNEMESCQEAVLMSN